MGTERRVWAASPALQGGAGSQLKGKTVRSQSNGYKPRSRGKGQQTVLSDCGWKTELSPKTGRPICLVNFTSFCGSS